MNRSSAEGGGMGDVVRILVADDHPLTRDGIKAALALDGEFEVGGEASDGQEAVNLAEEVQPDVVLMDVRMPVLGGIRATQAISRTVPNARVIMLTVEETQARVGEAIQAGAAGYLLKDIDAHELARAVHLAAEGSAVIHPNLTRQFIEEIRQLTRGEQSVSTLSAREVEVLQMIAYGSTNREVAEALHISPQTVKTYWSGSSPSSASRTVPGPLPWPSSTASWSRVRPWASPCCSCWWPPPRWASALPGAGRCGGCATTASRRSGWGWPAWPSRPWSCSCRSRAWAGPCS